MLTVVLLLLLWCATSGPAPAGRVAGVLPAAALVSAVAPHEGKAARPWRIVWVLRAGQIYSLFGVWRGFKLYCFQVYKLMNEFFRMNSAPWLSCRDSRWHSRRERSQSKRSHSVSKYFLPKWSRFPPDWPTHCQILAGECYSWTDCWRRQKWMETEFRLAACLLYPVRSACQNTLLKTIGIAKQIRWRKVCSR